MPEGPECHHITDILQETLVNKHLICIKILSGRYSRHGPPKGFSLITNKLQEDTIKDKGIKVLEIKVKGKFIYWKFESNIYMSNTLGMSGQWTTNKDKHCHIEFIFKDAPIFYYRDIRNFGTIAFSQEIETKLKKLGHDILETRLTDQQVIELFHKRTNWCLPKFMMNQGYLSGIGNYLKCEALFASGLSPYRKIESLTNKEIINLYQEICRIAKESYSSKGASFLTFRDPDSNSGKYSFNFQVYGKQETQGYCVSREKTGDSRSTYWVPELQN